MMWIRHPALLLLMIVTGVTSEPLQEHERVEEYHRRNYQWPLRPEDYVPNTEGWRALNEERIQQISEISDPDRRYEGFVQALYSARIQNFTEHGFGLAHGPPDLVRDLRKMIREELPNAREEGNIEVIAGPLRPLFIDRPDMTKRVLHELQSYSETWAGMELVPAIAYGFRLYRNDSELLMHVDKPQTHVVSFIFHIDSSDDAEDWPIFIEDFQGQTHEVVLAPGDVLFYESSKVFHGRPRKFNGSWYTSIFVHYYPKHGWAEVDHKLESHYFVPPKVWNGEAAPHKKGIEKLEMVGTSMKEPNCPDIWCRVQESVKSRGPAPEGYWLAPNGDKHEFNPVRYSGDEL